MFLRELGSKVTESLREIVEQDFIVIEHAPIYGLAPPPRRSKKLLTVEDYLNYVEHPINLTATHTIHHIIDKKWDKLRQAIFIHGLTDSVRPDAYFYLLGVDSSYHDIYDKIKWNLEDEQLIQVVKDVVRTDRNTALFRRKDVVETVDEQSELLHSLNPLDVNPNLIKLRNVLMAFSQDVPYLQGMADICAPFIHLYSEEWMIFGCLKQFYKLYTHKTVSNNNQLVEYRKLVSEVLEVIDPILYSHLQRIDAFHPMLMCRWLLTWFRREISFDDTFLLWEAIWSAPTEHMDVFTCAALMSMYREKVIHSCNNFEDVLKLFNASQVKADRLVERMETSYYIFMDCFREARLKYGNNLARASKTIQDTVEQQRVAAIARLGTILNLEQFFH